MEMVCNSPWSEIISGIVGVLLGAGITFQVTKNRLGKNASQVNQSAARAGGDVVGRDKNSR
jgi:hypothetical protein